MPSAASTPSFQGWPRGTSGQRSMPATSGLTACHTSTNGWPVTSTSGWSRVAARRCSFEPSDEVVEQDAEPAPGPGPEGPHDLGQVVGAVERLDDDPLDPQVVAPHPLDQLGVVRALDQDAAGPGDPGGAPGTATEPDAVRCARPVDRLGARAGRG